MSILHDIAKYGFLGDSGDLIDWIGTEQYEQFLYDEFCKKGLPYDPDRWGLFHIKFLQEVNQELRKPLGLSDFVRGPEPEAPNYTDSVEAFNDYVEGLDGEASQEEAINCHYEMRERDYSKLLEDWKNWTALFDGWEEEAEGTLRKGNMIVKFSECEFTGVSISTFFSVWGEVYKHSEITRENFIRLCKSHNIDLLNDGN